MQAITTAFHTLKNIGHKVVYLVYLSGVHRYLSTWPLLHSGPWLLNEGLVLGGGALLGDQHERYDREVSDLDNGGISAIEHDFDDRTGIARVGGTTLSIDNQALYSALTDSQTLDNAVVQVRLGFVGLGLADSIYLFTGVVDRYSISLDALSLDCIDGTFRRHRDLSVLLGTQYFPGTPPENRGKPIPIPLGRNTNVETLQITGSARGTLAFDVSTVATSCDLIEYGAPFPDSGTITLGSETGVTYTTRQQVILQNVSYLRLSGLVRGAPVTQAAGLAVVLTNTQFTFLIGYAVFDLTRVRIANVVQTSGYTFLQAGLGADRPVSTLTFTTEPVGAVTVDIRGGNLVPLPPFVNGDFETGTTTGWTVPAGVLTVTTGNTAEGLYKGELDGLHLSDGAMYQEFATIIGQQYTVRFSYRDTEAGVNLLTNGDFETGVLSPFVDNSVPGQGQVVVSASDPNTGTYAAHVLQQTGLSYGGYAGSFYYDLTTTIALPYVLSFWYTSETARSGSQAGTIFFHWASQAGYAIGTPANPIAISQFQFPQQQVGFIQGANGPQRLYYFSGPIAFTATATTTRLTFRGAGLVSGFSYPLDTAFDDIRVIQASAMSLSVSSYALGTPADDDLYAEATLAQSLGYLVQETSFRATAVLGRLTLRSQYTVTAVPTPTYYDAVTILDAGLNPVDAIRHIITTYVPDLPVNEAAFDAAHLAREGWRFGTMLREPGESRALLQRMAEQCACWYYEDAQGRATLVAIPLQPSNAVYGFTTSNIDLEDGDVLVQREPLDNVYTDFYVWYGYDGAGDREAGESYAGVVYATPTATNHADNLSIFCQRARALYGRTHRLDLYGDFLQDAQTAFRLLEHTVQTRTVRATDVTLRSWFGASHLERGDIVQVQYPLLPNGGEPMLGPVMRVQYDPPRAMVELRVKLIVPAGWTEEFEYPEPIPLGYGWSDGFDASDTLIAGPGWSEDFE